MPVKRSTLVLLLLLSACGGPAEEPAANQPQANAAEPAPAPKADVPSLAGEWTITQVNGAAPRQTWPMTASVGDGRFTIQSECRTFTWALSQQGNIVQFTSGSAGGCERTRSPAEEMIEQPVGQANIAMFSNEGREVQLSGPGGIVTMTRQ